MGVRDLAKGAIGIYTGIGASGLGYPLPACERRVRLFSGSDRSLNFHTFRSMLSIIEIEFACIPTKRTQSVHITRFLDFQLILILIRINFQTKEEKKVRSNVG